MGKVADTRKPFVVTPEQRAKSRREALVAALVVAIVLGYFAFRFSSPEFQAGLPQQQRPYIESIGTRYGEWVRDGAYTYARGSIVNRGTRTVTYWRVAAKYRDASGNVVDTGFTNGLDRLEPGDSKNFEIMRRADPRATVVTFVVEDVRPE